MLSKSIAPFSNTYSLWDVVIAPLLHRQMQHLVHAISARLMQYLLAVSVLHGSSATLAFCLPGRTVHVYSVWA